MPKKFLGHVTSDASDKTIVITVTTRETHPVYKKQYTVNRKYMAHDEKNEAKKGDLVEISECRPFSKRKTWKLDRIVEAGHSEIELKEEEILETPAEKQTKDEDKGDK